MEEKIDDFIENVVEEHLKMYENESEEIYKMRKRAFEISIIMKDKIDKLEKQEWEVLSEYESLRNEEEGMNYKYLYLAGVKDCIKLLKCLNIL